MAVVGWVVALVLGIVLALFSVQNQQAASVNLFGAVYDNIPTWVVMLGAATLGALMVIVISVVDRLRWFVSSRQSKKLLT
ncbi:MAG: LapA family protein, partial [Chloroflexi bacterium]